MNKNNYERYYGLPLDQMVYAVNNYDNSLAQYDSKNFKNHAEYFSELRENAEEIVERTYEVIKFINLDKDLIDSIMFDHMPPLETKVEKVDGKIKCYEIYTGVRFFSEELKKTIVTDKELYVRCFHCDDATEYTNDAVKKLNFSENRNSERCLELRMFEIPEDTNIEDINELEEVLKTTNFVHQIYDYDDWCADQLLAILS